MSGGGALLTRYHDRLAVMIEELGLGHHKTPCPACRGTGLAPKRFFSILAQPCRRCHGLRFVPLGSSQDIAMRMAMKLQHLWREIGRLQTADAMLRKRGLRVEQPVKDPYRP